MKTILRGLLLLAIGAAVTVLLAEAALRLLPVPDGVAAADPVADWPVRRRVPGAPYVSTSGWALSNVQRGRVNAQGYVAPFDYRPRADVGVVLGDSYVEGYMNPYDDQLQAVLARRLRLPQGQVYNFGQAGASLPDYLGVGRLAAGRYRPRWAVVLTTRNDFIEGFERKPGFFHWSEAGADGPVALTPEISRRGGVAGVARDLALVRYLRLNLKFDPATLLASGFSLGIPKACIPEQLTPRDEALLSGWVRALPHALGLPPDRIVILTNGDLDAIQSGRRQEACADRDRLALKRLRSLARESGMHAVDMGSIFAADWARAHVPLSRAPVDLHWNGRAHALAGAAAAEALARR